MVKKLLKDNKTLYVWEACDFAYQEEEWAQKCQQWCEKYSTCNIEITQHGAPLEDSDTGA
ncbi:MAG: hypothetical protein HY530_04550 [Chloroflexi bacterium]|nr:hypothetical protein [Chloroflexota bacterium]